MVCYVLLQNLVIIILKETIFKWSATLFAFPFHIPKPSYAMLSPGMKFRGFTTSAKKVSTLKASVHAVAVPLQKKLKNVLHFFLFNNSKNKLPFPVIRYF